MSRLFDKLSKGELALGVFVRGAPHLIPHLAGMGFDWVRPDMMFSNMDWQLLEHIVRAAQAYDLTPVVRVPTNPWLGGEENMQFIIDAQRVYAMGCPIVQASIGSVKQAEALIGIAYDWHKSVDVPVTSEEEYKERVGRVRDETWALPAIESLGGLRDLDKILSLEGMKAILFANTDLAEVLGHPMDYEHPDVVEVMDKAIAEAKKRGIVVAVNTGYRFNTFPTMAARIKRLYDRGVQMVFIQGVEFILSIAGQELMGELKKEFGVTGWTQY